MHLIIHLCFIHMGVWCKFLEHDLKKFETCWEYLWAIYGSLYVNTCAFVDIICCILCFVDLHLGIILVNDQLDAQFSFLVCLFQSSTCFEQPRAHHQLYQYNAWYMSVCVSDRLVCRLGRNFPACILDGHIHKVTYTRHCIDTIDSPDDEHEAARNM
jgi:hypothetical protein